MGGVAVGDGARQWEATSLEFYGPNSTATRRSVEAYKPSEGVQINTLICQPRSSRGARPASGRARTRVLASLGSVSSNKPEGQTRADIRGTLLASLERAVAIPLHPATSLQP